MKSLTGPVLNGPTIMRSFFRSHWKVIVIIALLILVAIFTMSPTR
jgi:uncharacterized integral membrane protein